MSAFTKQQLLQRVFVKGDGFDRHHGKLWRCQVSADSGAQELDRS